MKWTDIIYHIKVIFTVLIIMGEWEFQFGRRCFKPFWDVRENWPDDSTSSTNSDYQHFDNKTVRTWLSGEIKWPVNVISEWISIRCSVSKGHTNGTSQKCGFIWKIIRNVETCAHQYVEIMNGESIDGIF